MRSALGCAAVALMCGWSAPPTVAAPRKGPAPPSYDTRVDWRRDGTGRIEVTGSRKGRRLQEATDELQAVADRLDCLRTHDRHVRWSRLTWVDGRIEGLAVADSALYGNVALLAVRDLLPGRATAGSGIQQIRGRTEKAFFRVRMLIGPKRTKPKKLELKPLLRKKAP